MLFLAFFWLPWFKLVGAQPPWQGLAVQRYAEALQAAGLAFLNNAPPEARKVRAVRDAHKDYFVADFHGLIYGVIREFVAKVAPAAPYQVGGVKYGYKPADRRGDGVLPLYAVAPVLFVVEFLTDAGPGGAKEGQNASKPDRKVQGKEKAQEKGGYKLARENVQELILWKQPNNKGDNFFNHSACFLVFMDVPWGPLRGSPVQKYKIPH